MDWAQPINRVLGVVLYFDLLMRLLRVSISALERPHMLPTGRSRLRLGDWRGRSHTWRHEPVRGEDIRRSFARGDIPQRFRPVMSGELVPAGLTIRTAFSFRSVGVDPGGCTEYFPAKSWRLSYSLIR
jgi:hypothetical protein